MNTTQDINTLPTWFKSEPAFKNAEGELLMGGNIRILHDGSNPIKAVTTQYKIHQPRDVAASVIEAFDRVGIEFGSARMMHNNTGIVIHSAMNTEQQMPAALRKVGDSVGSQMTILTSAFTSTKAMYRHMVLACLNGMTTAKNAESLMKAHRSPLDVVAWTNAIEAMASTQGDWFDRILPYTESRVGGSLIDARMMFALLLDASQDLKVMTPQQYREALTEADRKMEIEGTPKMVERMMTHFNTGRNQTNREGAWKWLNAVTDYATHTSSIGDPTRREDSALNGALSNTVERRAYLILRSSCCGHRLATPVGKTLEVATSQYADNTTAPGHRSMVQTAGAVRPRRGIAPRISTTTT